MTPWQASESRLREALNRCGTGIDPADVAVLLAHVDALKVPDARGVEDTINKLHTEGDTAATVVSEVPVENRDSGRASGQDTGTRWYQGGESVDDLRERRDYWKQRAKSAEGERTALARREQMLEGALRGCAIRVVDDGWCWCQGHHDNRATHQAHCILARAALATERD